MKHILFILFISFTLHINAQTNIAPQATASAAPACNTGPCTTLNDLNFGTCGTQQMWITSNATNPGSAVNVTFIWGSVRGMNRMRIHAAQNNTRFLTGGTIQVLDGSTWVNHTTFTQSIGVCDYDINFAAVATTGIRIIDITVGGAQTSNVNFREIEIFEASTGPPPAPIPPLANFDFTMGQDTIWQNPPCTLVNISSGSLRNYWDSTGYNA
ncbi:MAG: hypothetical protein ACK574_03350, partial [Bacteroidota bacterium]